MTIYKLLQDKLVLRSLLYQLKKIKFLSVFIQEKMDYVNLEHIFKIFQSSESFIKKISYFLERIRNLIHF